MPIPRHATQVFFHINSPLNDLQHDFPPFFAENSLSSTALSQSHFPPHCVPVGSEDPVLRLRHARTSAKTFICSGLVHCGFTHPE